MEVLQVHILFLEYLTIAVLLKSTEIQLHVSYPPTLKMRAYWRCNVRDTEFDSHLAVLSGCCEDVSMFSATLIGILLFNSVIV